VQILAFGGWPVDCADEFLTSFAATDSVRCRVCGEIVEARVMIWVAPASTRGKVGGAVTREHPGWILARVE